MAATRFSIDPSSASLVVGNVASSLSLAQSIAGEIRGLAPGVTRIWPLLVGCRSSLLWVHKGDAPGGREGAHKPRQWRC